jgi:hypothetical protein
MPRFGNYVWFVREGCEVGFDRDVERWEMYGAWCTNKGILPSTPIDPVEVKMIKEGGKRAQVRLELPSLDI